MLPPKKYCDVTGFAAKYTAPSHPQLRYYSAAVYREILPYLRFTQEYVDLRSKGL